MADADAIRFRDPILVALEDPAKRASLGRRMALKVRRGNPEECWEWTARAACNGGYGGINAGRGRKMRAHRVAWALAGGDLPLVGVICHRCDNPKCCNPAHLFLADQIGNIADMRAKGRGASPPRHSGQRHHLATIADADIPALRADRRTCAELARVYGVSQKTIYRIKKGQTRAHQ